eukprot:40942-Chlamydomonas_euryale.AAC.1
MGIEFDVVKGKGPVIASPVRSMETVKTLRPIADPDASLGFTGETLSALRRELQVWVGRCRCGGGEGVAEVWRGKLQVSMMSCRCEGEMMKCGGKGGKLQ